MSELKDNEQVKELTTAEEKKQESNQKFISFMHASRENNKRLIEAEDIQKALQAANVSSGINSFFSLMAGIVNRINLWIDMMLSTKNKTLAFSLVIAIMLSFFVNGGTGISTTKSIDYIDGVNVNLLSPEGFEVSGYEPTVTIQLIGDYSAIQWARMMKQYSVSLDCQQYSQGNYDISYMAEGFSSGLDVKVIPEFTNVTLSPIAKETFALGYKFTNEKNLDSAYTLRTPQLGFLEVDITAGQATLDTIDKVVALIDVGNLSESVRDGIAPIVALDRTGKVIPVTIEPNSVKYDLDVVSFSKVVPLALDVRGKLEEGYSLVDIKTSINNVTIYGEEEELEDINEVVCIIDLKDRDTTITLPNVAIELPSNVTKCSDKSTEVTIVIEPTRERTFEVPVLIESLESNLKGSLIGGDKVKVTVSGAEGLVESLDASSIKVYVDLASYKSGTYSVPLQIANPDTYLTYNFEVEKVDVAIQNNVNNSNN